MSGWLLAAEAVTSGKRRIHKSPLKSSSVQNYSVNIRQLDYMQALSVSVCVCVCVRVCVRVCVSVYVQITK